MQCRAAGGRISNAQSSGQETPTSAAAMSGPGDVVDLSAARTSVTTEMANVGCKMADEASEVLAAVSEGDRSRLPQLAQLVYDDLRKLAGRYMSQERVGHTLQPTALVHEAFIKLVDQTRVDWRGRSHFFAVGAQAMRRILVNHAKRKGRIKRGGRRHRVPLDEATIVSLDSDDDVIAVDEALMTLAAVDERQARIVELRFFGGLHVAEIAEVMALSKRTVEREWTACRAWLRRELSGDDET
jgi:RNA polymerase sigma-70 factor (ECF subfamily)